MEFFTFYSIKCPFMFLLYDVNRKLVRVGAYRENWSGHDTYTMKQMDALILINFG